MLFKWGLRFSKIEQFFLFYRVLSHFAQLQSGYYLRLRLFSVFFKCGLRFSKMKQFSLNFTGFYLILLSFNQAIT